MIKKLPDNIWFPFWVEKWIFGSMRLEFNPQERAVWVDLLALAAKDSGYIRANEDTPYLMKQLAGLLIYDESFFKQTIDKFIKKGKLQIDKNGILYITKWDKYSFSPSRKRVEKHRLIKKGKKVVMPAVTNVANGVTHNITNHSIINYNKEDKEILNLLKNTKNYPYDYEEDLKFIRDLVVEFNDVEVFEKIKQICANWMDKPLLKKSRPRVQIRKWCLNERKWAKERKKDLMVGKSQKEPTKEEKQFKIEYDKKRQELMKKYLPEFEKAKRDGDLKAIGEVNNKIKQELAEWSNEYWEKK